jgi:hypothetical protein
MQIATALLLSTIVVIAFMSVLRDSVTEEFVSNDSAILNFQKEKSLAYFDLIKSFFMSQSTVSYPTIDDDKTKMMLFAPNFMDIYCENQGRDASDDRCKTAYINNHAIVDQTFKGNCSLMNTTIKGNRENAVVRILNSMYFITKTCIDIEVVSITTYSDGFRIEIDDNVNLSTMALICPTMISFQMYGLYKIIHNGNDDNIFTSFDNKRGKRAIYVKLITNSLVTPGVAVSTRRSLPIDSQDGHTKIDLLCTMYYLQFEKDMVTRSVDTFYNNMTLTFDKHYIMSRTNRFDTVFNSDIAIDAPKTSSTFLSKRIKCTFDRQAVNVFSVEIGANNTNAAPFICFVHPKFSEKVREIEKDDLGKQNHQFHIVFTYTMDKIIIAAFYRNVNYPNDNLFFINQYNVLSGNPVFLQYREPDIVRLGGKINFRNNVVPIFCIPNYALMAYRLGYNV